MELTPRNKNLISGLIALVILFGAIVIGIAWSFGAFDDAYQMKASFDAAGQGLQKGSDVKIRGVNIGKVESVHLVSGRASVTMEINRGNKIPTSATATVRAKTLFGEKFIDIAPGAGEASGPFYGTDGEMLDKCDKSKQPDNSCTQGGFELEQVLADAYPLLKKIDPGELMTVIHTLADGSRGLGPNVNRSIVNGQKVLDVNAAHDADTRQFLTDFAKLADQLGVRADDLVAGMDALNVALPTINDNADKLNSLLVQTARLSDDVADLLRNNKDFIDKSFGGGQQVLDLLYAHQNDIVPLVIGLREYVESLTVITRIKAADGTLMAAVKSLTCPQPAFLSCDSQSTTAASPAISASGDPTGAPIPGSSLDPLTGTTAPTQTGLAELFQYLASLGAP